jgi:hypothetical protein
MVTSTATAISDQLVLDIPCLRSRTASAALEDGIDGEQPPTARSHIS